MQRLSQLANRSVLWIGIAALLATFGGRNGRRAAERGLVSIGLTSLTVNVGLKSLSRRHRPERARDASLADRHVPMPASSSFPSGHSASAFAFATAASMEFPAATFPLRALAAAVAYSRVHTGVHYPGDALAGALLGAATGQLVARTMDKSGIP